MQFTIPFWEKNRIHIDSVYTDMERKDKALKGLIAVDNVYLPKLRYTESKLIPLLNAESDSYRKGLAEYNAFLNNILHDKALVSFLTESHYKSERLPIWIALYKLNPNLALNSKDVIMNNDTLRFDITKEQNDSFNFSFYIPHSKNIPKKEIYSRTLKYSDINTDLKNTLIMALHFYVYEGV